MTKPPKTLSVLEQDMDSTGEKRIMYLNGVYKVKVIEDDGYNFTYIAYEGVPEEYRGKKKFSSNREVYLLTYHRTPQVVTSRSLGKLKNVDKWHHLKSKEDIDEFNKLFYD